jgi:hypothetical protein
VPAISALGTPLSDFLDSLGRRILGSSGRSKPGSFGVSALLVPCLITKIRPLWVGARAFSWYFARTAVEFVEYSETVASAHWSYSPNSSYYYW